MTTLLAASVGLALFGPVGVGVAVVASIAHSLVPRRRDAFPLRPILIVLLVELRSGASVLSALHSAARAFPQPGDLQSAVRLATVAGLPVAVDETHGSLRTLLAHLVRAQASGSSAADAVRRMLESDIARERATRLNKTRSLPVRLMIPMALLALPGVVLISYGPLILDLLSGIVVPFE